MPDDFSLRSVEVVQSPLERFELYLQAHGKRITKPRRILVEQVFKHHQHFDADDLVAEINQLGLPRDRRPSRPTVYRTLAELVEAGMLRKMTLEGRAVYEHEYGYPDHDHLHCTSCHRLIEFSSRELERIRDAVAAKEGFRVTGHRLIVTGLCAACQADDKQT